MVEAHCVAVLKSKCGDWIFYDHGALQVATTSFALLFCSSSDTVKMTVDSMSHITHADAPNTVNPGAELHDGLSIEQWASYAKRKSNVASAVCKENGILKAKLNARPCGEIDVGQHVAGPPQKDSAVVDGIFALDPWRSASTSLAQG